METASISITTELISTHNKIRMAIYKNTDPLTMIQWIDEAAGVHAARTWNFESLERVMHFYTLLELDSSDVVVDVIIGKIYFLPSNSEFQVKNPVYIEAGVTPIPGSEVTTEASTIEENYHDKPTTSSEAFTLKGNVQEGAEVEVDFSWDDGSGAMTGNVVSTVLSGWTMADLVNDLYTKIHHLYT